MSDIDTAAIRAEVKAVMTPYNVSWARAVCDLCDALDAARAEAAEARIAAALDLCDRTQHPDIPVAPYAFVDMVRAALTGDQDG